MDSPDPRWHNKAAVLRVTATRGHLTRPELMAATNLSKATVSRVVRDLVDAGLIVEGPAVPASGRGRSAPVLLFNGGAGQVCGVDLGAVTTRFVVTDYSTRLIAAWRAATPVDLDAIALADWVAGGIAGQMGRRAMHPPVITVAVPGAVWAGQSIASAPTLPAVEGTDFVRRLRDRTPGTLQLNNDSNLGLLGELSVGLGLERPDAVMFTIGAGFGVGVFRGGRLLAGDRGFVGEFGTLPIDNDTRTVEGVLSAPGLSTVARECGLPNHSPRMLLGDTTAAAEKYRRIIGHALFALCVTMTTCYEPECIIIGGELASELNPVLPWLQNQLDAHLTVAPRVQRSLIADSAVAIGAVADALESAYRLLGASEGDASESPFRVELSQLARQVSTAWS